MDERVNIFLRRNDLALNMQNKGHIRILYRFIIQRSNKCPMSFSSRLLVVWWVSCLQHQRLISSLFSPNRWKWLNRAGLWSYSLIRFQEVIMRDVFSNRRGRIIDRLLSFGYRIFPVLFCFFCISFFLFLAISIIEVYSVRQMVAFGNEVSLFWKGGGDSRTKAEVHM